MLEYIILIAAVLILSLVCFNKFAEQKKQKVIKITFLCGCFALMLMYSAARVNIGWDYTMYTRGFFQMARDGFETLEYRGWEYGFTVLTKIIAQVTKNPHIYMTVISIICLSGPFYVIFRYSKRPWLSVLLYINLYFFYCTMNFLRQSIAISIIMFAYTFLIDRKFWRYLLLVTLAACFHVSALILIPVYFFANIKLSLKIPIMYCFFILWIYISSTSTIEIFTEYISEDYRQSVFLTEGLGFIHVVIPGLILLAGMLLLLKSDKYSQKEVSEILIVQTNLMYFSYLWLIVMLRHSLLERFSYYTYIFVILYVPELLSLADRKYKHHLNRRFFALSNSEHLEDSEKEAIIADFQQRPERLSYILNVFIIVITVLYNIYGLTAYDRGVHGVVPYQSWIG